MIRARHEALPFVSKTAPDVTHPLVPMMPAPRRWQQTVLEHTGRADEACLRFMPCNCIARGPQRSRNHAAAGDADMDGARRRGPRGP